MATLSFLGFRNEVSIQVDSQSLENTPLVGNIENDGQNYVGRIVVITDPRASQKDWCGDPLNEYTCHVI